MIHVVAAAAPLWTFRGPLSRCCAAARRRRGVDAGPRRRHPLPPDATWFCFTLSSASRDAQFLSEAHRRDAAPSSAASVEWAVPIVASCFDAVAPQCLRDATAGFLQRGG